MAGQLDDTAVGREVAAQDGEAAGGLERRLDRHDHRLARRLDGLVCDLAHRAAVDVAGARVHEVALAKLTGDQGHAAGVEHVRRDELAARLQAGHDRGAGGDLVELVDREGDVELAGDREQMQHAVGRAAARRHRRGRVLDRLAGDDVRGADVVAHELHRQPAALLGGVALAAVERRDAVQAGRADPQEVERHRHGVGGELAAAGARARTCRRLDLVQLGRVDRAGGIGADGLEHVLDGDVAAAERAGGDRAVVEHEPGHVQPAERHHAGRDGLVAADDADEPVHQVAAHDELDRVGDQVAADERRLHALGAHRHAVGDRDRVELHRRAAGRADAGLDPLRQLALVEVARHRLDPRRRDADKRLCGGRRR